MTDSLSFEKLVTILSAWRLEHWINAKGRGFLFLPIRSCGTWPSHIMPLPFLICKNILASEFLNYFKQKMTDGVELVTRVMPFSVGISDSIVETGFDLGPWKRNYKSTPFRWPSFLQIWTPSENLRCEEKSAILWLENPWDAVLIFTYWWKVFISQLYTWRSKIKLRSSLVFFWIQNLKMYVENNLQLNSIFQREMPFKLS